MFVEPAQLCLPLVNSSYLTRAKYALCISHIEICVGCKFYFSFHSTIYVLIDDSLITN